MMRGRGLPRLWPLTVALLAMSLLGALPLLAQQPSLYFLPQVGLGETEVTPQTLRIARVVLQGSGTGQNSDEYVQIKNVSTAPIELGGARLSGGYGLTPTRPYVFPTATLAAGASALLFSKVGNDNPEANLFYLDSYGNTWTPGQTAELRDGQGRLLSQLAVSGTSVPIPTAPLAPTAAPLPTVTPYVPGVGVKINDIVLRDPAFPDVNEEFTQMHNTTVNTINLTGWRLINASRPAVPAFVFPNFSLGSDLTTTVFTTIGDDDLGTGDFYWDQTGDVWREGDRAELRDFQGRLISSFIVPNQP